MTGDRRPPPRTGCAPPTADERASARSSHADADADYSRDSARRNWAVRATVEVHDARWLLIVPPSSRALTAQGRGSSAAWELIRAIRVDRRSRSETRSRGCTGSITDAERPPSAR